MFLHLLVIIGPSGLFRMILPSQSLIVRFCNRYSTMHFTVHKQKAMHHCLLWELLFTLGAISPLRPHRVYLYLTFHCLSLGFFFLLFEWKKHRFIKEKWESTLEWNCLQGRNIQTYIFSYYFPRVWWLLKNYSNNRDLSYLSSSLSWYKNNFEKFYNC